MNKNAQRRIVIIVLVALICSVFGTKIDKENLAKSPAITIDEWNTMVANAFGEVAVKDENGDKPLTGEYVAQTIMDNFEEDKIELLSGKDGYKDSAEFAVENGIVSKSQLKSEFSQEAAERALTIAMNLYLSEAMFPEYDETIYKENVVKAFDWKITATDESYTTIIAQTDGEVPKVGQILLLHDEYGIAKARKVVSSQQNNYGGYDLELKPVEDISEVVDVISFSGYADFDYMEENYNKTALMSTMAIDSNTATRPMLISSGFVKSAGKWLSNTGKTIKGTIEEGVEAISEDWDSATDSLYGVNINNHGGQSTDLEIGVAFETNDKGEIMVASIVKQDGIETEFGVNSEGELAASISFDEISENEISWDSDDEEIEEEREDGSFEEEASARIEGTVALKNFKIATRGFFVTTDWDDEDNYFDVAVYSDVEFNIKLSGQYENDYKIGIVKVPIPVTGGTVALEMEIYLCVSAEGEISMKWKVNGVQAALNVSVEDGVDTRFDIRDKSFEAEAKIEIAAGVVMQPAVSFCEWDIIDPSIKIVPLTASGSILPKNEGFEQYPPCMELGIRGIDIYLSIGYGDDSVTANLFKLIDAEIETEFHMLDSTESPLFNKVAHIETDLNGKREVVEKCTHKKPDPLGDLIEDVTGDSVEDLQDKVEEQASSWLEEMMTEMLEDMFMDSCGGCY